MGNHITTKNITVAIDDESNYKSRHFQKLASSTKINTLLYSQKVFDPIAFNDLLELKNPISDTFISMTHKLKGEIVPGSLLGEKAFWCYNIFSKFEHPDISLICNDFLNFHPDGKLRYSYNAHWHEKELSDDELLQLFNAPNFGGSDMICVPIKDDSSLKIESLSPLTSEDKCVILEITNQTITDKRRYLCFINLTKTVPIYKKATSKIIRMLLYLIKLLIHHPLRFLFVAALFTALAVTFHDLSLLTRLVSGSIISYFLVILVILLKKAYRNRANLSAETLHRYINGWVIRNPLHYSIFCALCAALVFTYSQPEHLKHLLKVYLVAFLGVLLYYWIKGSGKALM